MGGEVGPGDIELESSYGPDCFSHFAVSISGSQAVAPVVLFFHR